MKLTWEFLAGYFEGEGCVGYYKRYLTVLITSSNKWMLEEIHKQIPIRSFVSIQQEKGSSVPGGYVRKKDTWNVHWYGSNALAFLEQILPYLPKCSEKRPQIEMAVRIGARSTEWQAQRMRDMKKWIIGEEQPEEQQDKSQNILDFGAKNATS